MTLTWQRRALVLPLAAAAALVIGCLITAPLVPLFDPDEGYYPATGSQPPGRVVDSGGRMLLVRVGTFP